MKKDITFPLVEGVKVAIARKENLSEAYEWYAYLLNRNEVPLTNVMITSKGYGYLEDGEKQRTSTIRQLIAEIESNGVRVIERIDPSVFHLNNEYWISYYIKNQVYDKKFIFVSGSLAEENLITINQLELEGILHE